MNKKCQELELYMSIPWKECLGQSCSVKVQFCQAEGKLSIERILPRIVLDSGLFLFRKTENVLSE